MEKSVQHHAMAVLSSKGELPVPLELEISWAPKADWTLKKSPFPLPGFEPRIVQPIAQSLYWKHHTLQNENKSESNKEIKGLQVEEEGNIRRKWE